MSQQRERLAGRAAVRLWEKGREAWNAWVTAHPGADIDFSRVDFSPYGNVSFDDFQFPNGYASFIRTNFGDGCVSFNRANFHEGGVYFVGAKFGKGDASFNRAKFGEGRVSFNRAEFGRAEFGKGSVNFAGVEFGRALSASVAPSSARAMSDSLLRRLNKERFHSPAAPWGRGNTISPI